LTTCPQWDGDNGDPAPFALDHIQQEHIHSPADRDGLAAAQLM